MKQGENMPPQKKGIERTNLEGTWGSSHFPQTGKAAGGHFETLNLVSLCLQGKAYATKIFGTSLIRARADHARIEC